MNRAARARYHRRPRRRRDGGITLVELMVTILVASLVATSTFMFFAGQKQVYETQTKLLNIQQNLWASMEALTRNVRAAGSGMIGCVQPDPDDIGVRVGDGPPGGAAPPNAGIRVKIPWATMPPPYPPGTTRLAPLWIQNDSGGAPGTPDAFVVVYGLGTSGNFVDANLTSAVSGDADQILLSPAPANEHLAFNVGEFFLMLNNTANPNDANLGGRGCTLFTVTGINPAPPRLLANPATPWNPSGTTITAPLLFPFTYNPATAPVGIRNFGRLRWIRFAINNAAAPLPPTLTMHRLDTVGSTPQVLAEGIEDLQISYACDMQPAGGGDGVLTEGTNAATRAADEWIFNQPGEIIPAQCIMPTAVRITLIARSTLPDDTLRAQAGNFKPATEDGIVGVQDAFRHRTLRTTIFPRN